MKKTGFTITFEDGESQTVFLTPESYNAFIDYDNKKIKIFTKFIFYGNESNNAIAKKIVSEVRKHYNKNSKIQFKSNEFSIKFDFKYIVTTEDKAIKESKKNIHPDIHFVRIEESPLRSFYLVGGNSGFFSTKDKLGETTTAPHELAHGYGLRHSLLDQRGKGIPNIMCARGTFVDAIYQYDPKVSAGKKGGTINPKYRQVLMSNIQDILDKIEFDEKGRGKTNKVSNIIFDKDGYVK